MPIENAENGNVVMLFGSGDIRVSAGATADTMDAGTVCFFRKEPGPIGGFTPLEKPVTVSPEDIPVYMIFEKTESIDVVIDALQRAKRFMINGKVDTY